MSNIGNRKFYRLKFGNKANMEKFYECGEMRFGTFNEFKAGAISSDGRADRLEYADEYYAGNGLDDIKLNIDGYEFSKEGGLFSVEFNFKDSKQYTHLYCMSYFDEQKMINTDTSIDERNFAKDKDYVVVVYDLRKFANRVEEELKNCGLTHYQSNYIEYFNADDFSGNVGCFKKSDEYSYQNEWRIAVNFGQDKEDEPQIIKIGSLEGIATRPLTKEQFYNGTYIVGGKRISNDSILKNIGVAV